MMLALSDREATALRAFLDANADCEALSEREYVADLYDLEAPMSMDLVFCDGGVRIDGACPRAARIRRHARFAGYHPSRYGRGVGWPLSPALYRARIAV